MDNFYKPSNQQPEPECEERAYWRKRFNFASWLFLIFGLYAIFTDRLDAGVIAICASVGFQLFDSINQIRHIKWHIKQLEEGKQRCK